MVGIRFGDGSSLYPVLTSLPEGESVGDKQPREEVFESTGSWTHPGSTSLTHVDVLLVGGGGGGGGGYEIWPFAVQGGSGGGGGVRRMSVPVSPGSYTVTIGAGGAAGTPSSTPGSIGGQSEFGSAPYPALSPTAYYVGGGGLGRAANDSNPNATLCDAPAEGGGGGATSGRDESYGTAPFIGNSGLADYQRAGRGGANGFPSAVPFYPSNAAGGAGGNGIANNNYQGGFGLFGCGGGGSGGGDPGSNYMKWYAGSADGGAAMKANPTVSAPSVPWGGYPWNFGGIPGTGGGGAGGTSANPGSYARQGTAGGSGLCVVRWWE